jgi:hypothetical protein
LARARTSTSLCWRQLDAEAINFSNGHNFQETGKNLPVGNTRGEKQRQQRGGAGTAAAIDQLGPGPNALGHAGRPLPPPLLVSYSQARQSLVGLSQTQCHHVSATWWQTAANCPVPHPVSSCRACSSPVGLLRAAQAGTAAEALPHLNLAARGGCVLLASTAGLAGRLV